MLRLANEPRTLTSNANNVRDMPDRNTSVQTDTDARSNPVSLDDPRERSVMEAVYDALIETGYPDLTMATIADHSDQSKAMLYYHYDDKEDLLNAFFSYLSNRLEQTLVEEFGDDPYEDLLALVNRIIPEEMDDEQLRFRQVYFEIRSQGPHNRSYHEQIQRSDRLLLEALSEILEEGIERGVFRAGDPDATAQLLLSTIYGIVERGVTVGDKEIIEQNHAALIDHIENSLVDDAE